MSPFAAFRPSAWMSLMKSTRPTSFCPPATMPNSPAVLIALIVSVPALARPMISAFEAGRGLHTLDPAGSHRPAG